MSARDKLSMQRLRNHHLTDPATVMRLSSTNPWPDGMRLVPRVEACAVWLKLGFHPSTARRIKRAFHMYSSDPFHRTLLKWAFGAEIPIRLCWRNALPNILNLVGK